MNYSILAPGIFVLGTVYAQAHPAVLHKEAKGGCLSATSWAPIQTERFTSTALHLNTDSSIQELALV